MEKENKITLGGFDAILDSFIPNVNKNVENIIADDSVEEDELDNIKKNQFDPITDNIKNKRTRRTIRQKILKTMLLILMKQMISQI